MRSQRHTVSFNLGLCLFIIEWRKAGVLNCLPGGPLVGSALVNACLCVTKKGSDHFLVEQVRLNPLPLESTPRERVKAIRCCS